MNPKDSNIYRKECTIEHNIIFKNIFYKHMTLQKETERGKKLHSTVKKTLHNVKKVLP